MTFCFILTFSSIFLLIYISPLPSPPLLLFLSFNQNRANDDITVNVSSSKEDPPLNHISPRFHNQPLIIVHTLNLLLTLSPSPPSLPLSSYAYSLFPAPTLSSTSPSLHHFILYPLSVYSSPLLPPCLDLFLISNLLSLFPSRFLCFFLL